MNQLTLTGVMQSAERLAYTPAGTPVLRFSLRHQSSVVEAGKARTVNCEIECVVLGELANTLSNARPDETKYFTGFLAAKSLKIPRPVFHITQIDG